ncbi:MAG: bifunctional folylpolyglutamate synthase/dihydrofolate synthase [Spirochaetales bacterium]|nr:bifunctional folylpolyglutamate synthase/dihydrofolate synthase [Spirochaetales bacterium]
MAFGTLEEVFRYIESFTNLEKSGSLFSSRSYRLDRMRPLLQRFGQPQLAYRTIHIAGTKGKGSTATLLAHGLRAAGVRTGLYTSPHVTSYMERMEVLGSPPDVPKVLELAERIRAAVERLPEKTVGSMGPPNTFELLTLLAFCYFRETSCEYVVVETGIGGRLDATNLVDPELCLITPIELEHTEVLGDSLQAIAREKAGIFKAGKPVFSAPQREEVRTELKLAAARTGCAIEFLDERLRSFRTHFTTDGTEVRFTLEGGAEVRYRLALIGSPQAENAALVHLAVQECLPQVLPSLARGFAAARLPARMEILQRDPVVVIDGAHTPRSVQAVLDTFRRLFGSRGVLLFAAAAGKRISEMAEILAPAFRDIVVTTPGTFRESNAAEVYEAFRRWNANPLLIPDTKRALEQARSLAGTERPLLVTGSFYLGGLVREVLYLEYEAFADRAAAVDRSSADRSPLRDRSPGSGQRRGGEDRGGDQKDRGGGRSSAGEEEVRL